MSFLLDTHALVWWLLDKDRLSKDARTYIQSRDHSLFISTVSAYEIELKRGRDASLYRFPRNIPESVPMLGFEWLPVEAADGFRAARFDLSHKDPWDRIIAAQAARRDFMLITSDDALTAACRSWNVSTLW
jgi:PIN domain nuclease of toxin-antitoxin system